MATLNQIKVNTGTEANPTYVLHDVHDKRLDDGANSLVTTCTHLLATNAALSSFNPITSTNLASVLGACMTNIATTSINLNDLNDAGLNIYSIAKQNIPATNKPSDSSNYGIVVVFGANDRGCAVQLYVDTTLNKTYHFYMRFAGINGWRDWVTIG